VVVLHMMGSSKTCPRMYYMAEFNGVIQKIKKKTVV
jgi:hypothetical protein